MKPAITRVPLLEQQVLDFLLYLCYFKATFQTSICTIETCITMDLDTAPDVDITTQEILLAAAHHDIPRLRVLLRNSTANVQDPETGCTPLHSAIAACAPSEDQHVNGNASESTKSEAVAEEDVDAAEKTIKFLFQNGAIWNDLDANNETPGCLALRLGLKGLYDIVVDAGVRAELLLRRLDEYGLLGDTGDEDDDEDEEDQEQDTLDGVLVNGDADETESVEDIPVIQDAGAGVDNDESTLSTNYLSSNLSFQNDRLLDSSQNGVMMSWETTIMQRSTDLLLPSSTEPNKATILNIGHGMGIIDTMISEKHPASHHIIEAHPQVLAQMQQQGWTSKPNTTVHAGKWQDVLPQLIEQGVTFDAIYFDTFAEDYKAFRDFFGEYVIALLKPEGVWSFFNGLGADRQVCYDVYGKVLEMDLFEAGFDVDWESIDTKDVGGDAEGEGEWAGVRRRYWALDQYRLPLCRFVG